MPYKTQFEPNLHYLRTILVRMYLYGALLWCALL